MEWINDGVESPSEGAYVVAWRPARGEVDAQVVTTHGVAPVRDGGSGRLTYVRQTVTYYRSGGWEHQAVTRGEHRHETKRAAASWARRDAELEAGNRAAVAWDGQVPA